MSKGIIFDIKEFTVHDGPGLRTTVFFKGCPLNCLWCHNPEGISRDPQLMVTKNGCLNCGKCRQPCGHPQCQPLGRCVKICPKGLLRIASEETDAEDLAVRLMRQAPFLNDGGVTFSGGEPLMQPDFLFEMLERLKAMHTVIESCGLAPETVFRRAVELCSIFYLDIKHMDPVEHKRLTGTDNRMIQQNLGWLMEQEKPFVVRATLIPGLNDSRENLCALAERLKGAKSLERVELLPHNPFTGAKYEMTNMEFSLKELTECNGQVPLEEFTKRGINAVIL